MTARGINVVSLPNYVCTLAELYLEVLPAKPKSNILW